MKKIRFITALLSVILLVGCTQPKEEAFKLSDVYTELSEDNSFHLIEKDDLQELLEHGTAVVFLGFPECVWCQAYLPMLDEVLKEQGGSAEYYNIYVDKTEDRPFYDEVAGLIDQMDDTILSYDNNGKRVIYMPLVLFIEDGKLIGYDNETSTEDSSVISPADYWTDEKADALRQKLSDLSEKVIAARDENDSKGCENGCKVGD